MKNMLFYPAIFQEENEGYSVQFPDIRGAITQGDTMEEAYKMAQETLGLMVSSLRDEKEIVPEPSDVKNIKTDKNQAIVIVGLDYVEFLKKYESKAVKKTLTIPEWLNKEALELGVNFSQVLQEALVQIIQKKVK